jgi:hypothetical protein
LKEEGSTSSHLKQEIDCTKSIEVMNLNEVNILSNRKDSIKKKRPAKTRIMNLALETVQNERNLKNNMNFTTSQS